MTIKSSRFLHGGHRSVTKRATPGERVMGKLFPNSSYATSWSNNRFEQVQHFLDWQFIAINTIWSKIASIHPNLAYVTDVHKPGVTVKACERGMMGGAPPMGGPRPPMPMPMRANGGRLTPGEMTAGACSGEGREEKAEMVRKHRGE